MQRRVKVSGGLVAFAVGLVACRGERTAPTQEAGTAPSHGIAPAASRAELGRPPRAPHPPVDEAALASVASAVVRREPPSTFVVDVGVRKVICDNKDGAFREARLVPEGVDGGLASAGPWAGVRVFGVRPTMLLGKLGLVNGDLVTGIDELPLDSQASGDAAIERLCASASLTVHVGARHWQDAGPQDLHWRMAGDAG
jgi:hypothetical protein